MQFILPATERHHLGAQFCPHVHPVVNIGKECNLQYVCHALFFAVQHKVGDWAICTIGTSNVTQCTATRFPQDFVRFSIFSVKSPPINHRYAGSSRQLRQTQLRQTPLVWVSKMPFAERNYFNRMLPLRTDFCRLLARITGLLKRAKRFAKDEGLRRESAL